MSGSEAMLLCQNRSAPSPDSKALSKSVFFWGWRFANIKFESWAKKMASLHEPIWRKAEIFEAVIASTYKILRNTDLVLGIANKWCPHTKTFVFSWGEATITLEDVMLLSGFSVLGSRVSATLDSSGEKLMAKLDEEWKKIKKDKVNFVTQVAWMERFMNCGDELEHVAFLVLWLNYFVFPSRLYHLYKAVLPIAVHLSCGTRIALAPPVLARLYADLSLLKTHITAFSESTSTARIDLTALFKLVQVWTWERFKELQPKPNPMQKDEQRLARWHNLKQNTSTARQILDNSNPESFELHPYAHHMFLSPFNETNSSNPPIDFDGAMENVDTAPEMVPSPFDENNTSDPPLGANQGVVDIVFSPLETRQTCDAELDVHESCAEKMTIIDNGSKEPEFLLQKYGILAGQKVSSDEKFCSSEAEKEYDVVDDDSLIQKKLALEELALNADNNGLSPYRNLASGDETSKAYKNKVLSPSDESNFHIAVGEGSQGQDCLHHDNSLVSEETMKSSEDFGKRINGFDFDADNDSAKKRIQELKVLTLSIEERIIKVQKNVALIKERRAAELRRIARLA